MTASCQIPATAWSLHSCHRGEDASTNWLASVPLLRAVLGTSTMNPARGPLSLLRVRMGEVLLGS